MIKDRGNINSIVRGRITAGYRDIATGKFTKVLEQKNLVTYGGADIMAKLLSGDSRYAINGMYFKYENTTEVPSGISPSREHTAASQYHSLDGEDKIDWLRIPIITNGKIAPLPEDSIYYSGNSVTFVATTASIDAVGRSGNYFEGSGVDGPSKIFSIALVAMPDISSVDEDIAFSMTNLSSAIPAIENSYIDVFWTVSFT